MPANDPDMLSPSDALREAQVMELAAACGWPNSTGNERRQLLRFAALLAATSAGSAGQAVDQQARLPSCDYSAELVERLADQIVGNKEGVEGWLFDTGQLTQFARAVLALAHPETQNKDMICPKCGEPWAMNYPHDCQPETQEPQT